MLIDLRFDLYISPQDFRSYVKRATEGDPQPIAISSSFQRAMTQMQQAQQRLDMQNRENNNNNNSSGGGVSGISVSGTGGSSSNNNGGSGGVRVTNVSGDHAGMGDDAGDEKRLPPNKDALNPDGAAPSLQL